MLCFRRHIIGYSSGLPIILEPANHTFSVFLICWLVSDYGHELKIALLKLGLWDADTEGGLIYWQWPWKATYKKRFRHV